MPFWRVAIISQTGRGHALTKLDRLLSPGRDRATIIKFQRDQLQTALFRWIWPCQDTIGDNKFGSSGLLQLIVFTSIGKPYSPSTSFRVKALEQTRSRSDKFLAFKFSVLKSFLKFSRFKGPDTGNCSSNGATVRRDNRNCCAAIWSADFRLCILSFSLFGCYF